jgi:hypothetical protein
MGMGDSDLVRHRIRAGSRRQIRHRQSAEIDVAAAPGAARPAADQIT